MAISGVSTTGGFYAPLSRAGRAEAGARTDAAAEREAPQQRLTPEEEAEVKKLKARDREVRAHEAAHVAAGAGLAGGATFSYQRGPDGVSYAIGGEVTISTSPGRTPEETIDKARRIRAAALAPADPSGQDRAIAAAAAAMEREAQTELVRAKENEATAAIGGDTAAAAITGAYRNDAARIGRQLDVFA